MSENSFSADFGDIFCHVLPPLTIYYSFSFGICTSQKSTFYTNYESRGGMVSVTDKINQGLGYQYV